MAHPSGIEVPCHECRSAFRQFDNRTGVSADAGHIHCGQLPEQQSDQLGQERALAMLKAFRK